MPTLSIVTIANAPSYVLLPTGYDPNKVYPVLIELPGLGETAGPVTTLGKTGLFKWLGVTNPPDIGQMIAIGIEPNMQFGTTIQIDEAYLDAVEAMFKVSAICLTGYSLGCQEWANWAESAESSFSRIAALYFISADTENQSPYGTAVFNPALYAKYPVFDFRACGTADSFYSTQLSRSQAILNNVPRPLITPLFQPYQGLAHSSAVWDTVYNPSTVIPVLGRTLFQDIVARFSAPQPTTSSSSSTSTTKVQTTTTTTTTSTSTKRIDAVVNTSIGEVTVYDDGTSKLN